MLPFTTPPAPRSTRQIGTPGSGIIEMEVRGGLSVAETEIIGDLIDPQPPSVERRAKLAEAIATEEGISLTEAARIIDDAASGRSQEAAADAIRLRHLPDINEVIALLRVDNRRSTHAIVTALIRTRCNRPEWSLADTAGLDYPIFNGIYQLALDEQLAEDSPAAPPTEEDIKKQPPVTPRAAKRTGPKSSGN